MEGLHPESGVAPSWLSCRIDARAHTSVVQLSDFVDVVKRLGQVRVRQRQSRNDGASPTPPHAPPPSPSPRQQGREGAEALSGCDLHLIDGALRPTSWGCQVACTLNAHRRKNVHRILARGLTGQTRGAAFIKGLRPTSTRHEVRYPIENRSIAPHKAVPGKTRPGAKNRRRVFAELFRVKMIESTCGMAAEDPYKTASARNARHSNPPHTRQRLFN